MRRAAVLFALALGIASAGVTASNGPELPDVGTGRCYETSLLIDIAKQHPHSTPREFVGTPWATPLRYKDQVERAEQRREFVRDCAKLGYRLPDTPDDLSHNKLVHEKQGRDFEKAFDAAVAWHMKRRDPQAPPKAAEGIPPITPSAEEVAMVECADSWRQQMSTPRYLRDQVDGDDRLTPGARLAARCGRYGFEEARDAAMDERNRRAWERLNDRIAELRKRDGQALMHKLVGGP